jgi:hypothetical protein
VRLCVSVPVLKRPHRVAPLVASLEASLEGEEVEVAMVFVCSTDDAPQIAAVEAAGFEPLLSGQAFHDFQYAVKTNAAARAAEADWYLLAADDLDFRPGWLREALKVHAETGALVVGTNDLGNDLVKRGKHSTHPFVHRDYLQRGTIDQDDRLLHEGYRHNSVDVEFCETAMFRGMWAFAVHSHVRHMHPLWDKSVPRDQTYTKGIRYASTDRRLLNARRSLWGKRKDDATIRSDGRRVTRR